jgi:hypothetical protein
VSWFFNGQMFDGLLTQADTYLREDIDHKQAQALQICA